MLVGGINYWNTLRRIKSVKNENILEQHVSYCCTAETGYVVSFYKVNNYGPRARKNQTHYKNRHTFYINRRR